MKVYDEFKGKKTGDRVRLWCDSGTIEEIVSDGWPSGTKMGIAYWVKWDDYAPTCVSFDAEGNWLR